jgi:hypothetical protein
MELLNLIADLIAGYLFGRQAGDAWESRKSRK